MGSPKKGIVNRTAWGSGIANERDCALLAELEAADALMEAHHKVCTMGCGVSVCRCVSMCTRRSALCADCTLLPRNIRL